MNKSICIHPWNSMAVRPYGVSVPCCKFRAEDDFANQSRITQDPRNHESWINIRKDMLAGIPIKSCSACYQEEASGADSMRSVSVKSLDRPLPASTDCDELNSLEIAFSNLCNLACVSCSRWLSSTWASEDYKHKRIDNKLHGKIVDYRSLVSHGSDIDQLDLRYLRTLKIIGGEPFMDQEKFINLMQRLDLSKITLRVSTNGTVLPNERLKSLIDQCQRVVIEVSIDGIGSVGEWYRWPTKFEEVKQVMNQFQDWWGNDSRFEFGTHTVINVFNIWNLDSIVHFMNDNYPAWELYFDWMYNPGWQAICIIPEEFKSEIKSNLLKWNDSVTGNWGAHTKSPFLATVDRLNDKPKSNWETFKERTFNLANERNLDVLKMVPELAKILKST